MKRLYLLLLLGIFGGTATVEAQDFLVTINRDTLNCKLGKLKNSEYPIAFYLGEEYYEGMIHQDSILVFRKNMFRSMQSNRLRPWYPFVELQFDGGMMHQFGPFRYDDDLTDRSEFGARTGLITGACLTYYVNELVGYGLKYGYRQQLGGDIKSHYISAALNFRFWGESRKNHVFLSFAGGIGLMRQKNAPIQLDLLRPRIEMSARTFVGDIGVGYKMKLTRNISAHAKLSTMIGYPGFVRITDINKLTLASDKPLEIGHYCHNMNSVNLTVGISFHN
jgi:hypothetical protein